MRQVFIDDVSDFPFAFPTFCFTPCIVKRGSRCLLIVKLGICIPSGDLTIQLLPMVFLSLGHLFMFGTVDCFSAFLVRASSLFLYFPIISPDIPLFAGSRISIDSANVLSWCSSYMMQDHRCRTIIGSGERRQVDIHEEDAPTIYSLRRLNTKDTTS